MLYNRQCTGSHAAYSSCLAEPCKSDSTHIHLTLTLYNFTQYKLLRLCSFVHIFLILNKRVVCSIRGGEKVRRLYIKYNDQHELFSNTKLFY